MLELIDQDSTLLVQRDDFESTSLHAYKLAPSVGNANQKSLPIRIRNDGKLTIEGVGWEEGKITYGIEIKQPIVKQFEMHVTASEFKKGCGGMRLEEVYFTGVTAQKERDYYSIVIVP